MEFRLSEWVGMDLVQHCVPGLVGLHRKCELSLLYKHEVQSRGRALRGKAWPQLLLLGQYCSAKAASGAWCLGVSIFKQKWALFCRGGDGVVPHMA